MSGPPGEEVSVCVGIRIRPFNGREKALGAQLCVDMVGGSTILQVPEEQLDPTAPVKKEYGPDGQLLKNKAGDPKQFTFDASFWSHDGFVEEESGYLRAEPGGRYADQQLVFEAFGKKVLDNAWQGYHCCLFAYGQTGSGKSYSMVGYGANKGIVPISCEEIFRRIDQSQDPSLSFEVQVSMVEIYNEQVQDLLVETRLRPKKGLEIRESQLLGIYIDGVKKRPVNSYASIEAVMQEGTENRTVGSTLMNATSSRAHTVITIEFKQISTCGGQTGCKVSLINLVDLAGSEKAGQTGAQGDRLKEGSAINKSLSALGNVIEKLADRATGKAKASAPIPYRDSKLTRLLQNALGGSSKTVMICAISPATSNYEETLSTLRYADRAKRIKNAAVVNENPQDKLIRQLREENAKLKDMVGSGPSGGDNDGALLDQQAEIKQLEQALNEMQRSFQERLSEAQVQATRQQRRKEDPTLPHIANLNEDQLLTNKLSFFFREGETRIGRAATASSEEGHVGLAGPGIHEEHALVLNLGGSCTLTVASKEAGGNTFVNGASVDASGSGVTLAHGDRLAFGQSLFFFVDPTQGLAEQLLASGNVNYNSARKELAELAGGAGLGPSEEELRASREEQERLERRAREAEEAKNAAQQEAESRLKQREEDFKRQLEQKEEEWRRNFQEKEAAKDRKASEEQSQSYTAEVDKLKQDFEERQQKAEETAQRKIQELEARARRAAAEEEDHRQHELNMQRLEEQLVLVMPLVKEANLICEELRRPHVVETKMQCDIGGERSRGLASVVATVSKNGVRLFQWSPETLENRVFLLRELLQRCDEEGIQIDSLSNEEDPLWDPVEEEQLIGVSQVLLEGLLLQVEHQFDARILSPEGHQAGTLHVEILPLGKDGTPGIPDAEVVEDPKDLLGTRLAAMVKVESATGIPEALANDVRVEYNYFIDDKPHQVPSAPGFNCNPQFSYTQTFVQDPVTSRFLQYLKKKLVFRIYGRDIKAVKVAEAERQEGAGTPELPPLAPLQQQQQQQQSPSAAETPHGPGQPSLDHSQGQADSDHAPLPGQMIEEPAPGTPGQGATLTKDTGAGPSLAAVRRQQQEATTAATAIAPQPQQAAGGGANGKSKSCILL